MVDIALMVLATATAMTGRTAAEADNIRDFADDSLEVVQFRQMVEENIGVEITDAELDEAITFSDLIRLCRRKAQEKSA